MSLKEIRGLFLSVITLVLAFSLTYSFAPKLFFNIGKAKFDKGDYNSAQHYFMQSLIFKPENKDYRFYYVKTLTKLPATYDVQKKVYDFAQKSIDDSATIIANDQVARWRKAVLENAGNNYIEQVPQDTNVIRWNKKTFPLKVYVERDESVPDYYYNAVSRALKQWDSSFKFLSFKMTRNKSDSDINILFKDIPQNMCEGRTCTYVSGFTEPQINGKTLKRMTITLYKTNPHNKYLTDYEMYNIILHELGHALGILGHSYSTNDLMYLQAEENNPYFSKFRSDFQYLSGNDINTLNLLYKLEPTITNHPITDKHELIYTPIILGNTEQMQEKKIKEHLAYIQKTPDNSAGYINLASAYVDQKRYNKAVNALNSALDRAKTDDEKYLIYYNFAIVYMYLNERIRSLEFANLAKNIKSTPEINELIGVIRNNVK